MTDGDRSRGPAAQVAGVILAGGAATRIGGEKALLPFAGGTLLDAVIARAEPQVSQLALNVHKASVEIYRVRYAGYRMLFDSFGEQIGPLAGVITGLEWVHGMQGVHWLATFPCDTPFLPHDLIVQLVAQGHDAPVFAHDGNRQHGICAIWPLGCVERLREGVEVGHLRSVQSAMKALGAQTCVFESQAQAFFNINTRDDLARAEEIARSTG